MTSNDKKIPKIPKKYFCNFCYYFTDNKKDFEKHLSTQKHKNRTNDDKMGINSDKMGINSDAVNIKIPKNSEYICVCGKEYKYRQGLFQHKKKCNFQENSQEIIEKKINNEVELKDMFLSVVNDNKELRNMIVEQQKTILTQGKQITEIIPKIGNNNSTTTNNTINNNQRLSINVFLNEKCKDAINMSDFIKSIHVSLQQLDFTKTQGLEKGISNVIMENMNKLSLYERPMHCTDTKRETIYIKDNDTWEKDNSKTKLKNVIRKTSNKNYIALTNWTKENPDFMNHDEKQMFYARAMSTLGKSIDDVDDKIIKKLCSNIYLKESLDN